METAKIGSRRKYVKPEVTPVPIQCEGNLLLTSQTDVIGIDASNVKVDLYTPVVGDDMNSGDSEFFD